MVKIIFRRIIYGVAAIVVVVGCAMSPDPAQEDPAILKAYEQAGRRDGEYLRRYRRYLEQEVQAGRLAPVQAEQLYRDEERRLNGITCTGMPGPILDVTCR